MDADGLLDWLKGFLAGARYGHPEQRSLLVQAAIAAHRIMSDTRMHPDPDGARVVQHGPVRLLGPGKITVRGQLELGVPYASHLLTGIFIAARTPDSAISFDDACVINNGVTIISEGASIAFGKRVLVGSSLFCVDSNFHDLAVERRRNRDPAPAPVRIGDDVLIGEGVKILKGCDVGAGSIIAAGAVLLPGFCCPPNSTVIGNPAVAKTS
jgi:acetyltransferase-like isoleucine patch superfamily enzyme